MANVSFGSLTLVDLTDLGEFSVYPMANLPVTVVNNPNNNSYTPNWSSTNLTVTPVAYYAGQSVTPTSVTWTVQINAGSPAAISSSKGETVSSNVLKVAQNRFSDNTVNMITYYCDATYTEPDSGTVLNAKGQITFSIVRQANEVKTCDITGESIFKYDTTGSIVGFASESVAYITLTGTVANVTISKWQYKNSSGTWTNFPVTSGHNTSNSESTIKVYATESVFVNDVATIKLTTNDSNVFDIFVVSKLRDGAAGTDTVSAVLSNEDQMIPCNSSGTPTTYAGADTTISIFEGGKDVTSNWTITATPTNISGSFDTDKNKYTVTGISADTGYVTFTCVDKASKHADIIKTFNLIKMKVGADGTSPTIYSIDCSSLALNRTIGNVYSPASVTFYAYSQTGDAAKTAYNGVFKIYENGSSTAAYTTSSTESSYTYTPSGGTLKTIKCELYKSGGSVLVDTQTVVITSDGQTGQNGAAGKDAYTITLSNESHTFLGDTSKAIADSITINIYGYKGATQMDTTVGTISGAPTGMTATVNNNGGKSTSVTVAVTTSMVTKSGTLSIPVTIDGKTFTKTFSFVLALKGANGTAASHVDVKSSATLFKSNDGGKNWSPSTITLTPTFQTVTYSKWQYSTNGGTSWTQVTSGQHGLTIASNALTVSASSDLYTSNVTSVVFQCVSSNANYTDTVTIPRIMDGVGITGTKKYYCLSNDNTTAPASDNTGWSETLPTASKDTPYLWEYEVVTYSDGSTEGSSSDAVVISTLVKDISSITDYYARSNSNTSAPADNAKDPSETTKNAWSTTPWTMTTTYKYLWNYEVISYRDGSSDTSAKKVIGVYGNTGTSALSIDMGNYADVIPCTSGGLNKAQYIITIPFKGFYGTTQKYTTASISGDIYGTTTSSKVTASNTAGTGSAQGSISYTIPANALIGSSANTTSGTITITFTVYSGTTAASPGSSYGTIQKTYTWSKSNAAVNALYSDIYAPIGNVIINGDNNVTLKCRMLEGGTELTTGVSYKWYQYNSGSTATDKYDASTATGNATSTLTVTPSMVDGYASFKCIATYGGKNYPSFYSVNDKTDPLQVDVMSTIGNQITNGVGNGAVYSIVYRAGVELDPMPQILYSTEYPSKATGTECYVIDTTAKAIKYYKRASTSASWGSTVSSPSNTCTYTWTFRDKNGNSTSYNGQTSVDGKVLYVDGSLIDKKIIFDLKVEV